MRFTGAGGVSENGKAGGDPCSFRLNVFWYETSEAGDAPLVCGFTSWQRPEGILT